MVLVNRRLRAAATVVTLAAVVVGGQAAARPKKAAPAGTYTVVRGDTLSRIAKQHGTTVRDLAAANGIADIHHVRLGARLTVPSTGVPATAKATPAKATPAKTSRPNLRTTVATPKPPKKVSSKLPAKLRRSPERLALWGHFDEAARTYSVPADLLKAMAWQESGWQNHKVSSTNAVGIGQLMPDTIDFVNEILLRRARLDPGKPEHNIRMSARFLRYLLDQRQGDVDMAVASYYQGLAGVRSRGVLPETELYVRAVLAQRRYFA
ncbi:MAG: transglycosylase SLT domain-containing protein [Actinobacteria bacterium]|nr:transglycosylase SLT domain-containing protein [Actinomycetota bacterium]